MPQSEMMTLAHWEGKNSLNKINNNKKNTGQRAKSAARPPGNVPVLPMASPRLVMTCMTFFILQIQKMLWRMFQLFLSMQWKPLGFKTSLDPTKWIVYTKMKILSLITHPCCSKPVRPLFIFGMQIKVFLMKSESFLTLHRQQHNWHVQGPER